MSLWRDDVVEALRSIGGVGHLSQIYEAVREVRQGPLPQNLKAIVRKELEYNSSDADAFQNKRDLFYSVEGIGNGVWGLRELRSVIHVGNQGFLKQGVVGVPLKHLKKDAVLKAIQEFDRIGRNKFLEKYGFGKARRYFLVFDGKYYDSKAIAGAAYGYVFPNRGPLKNSEFSGGLGTVVLALSELGFELSEGKSEWLILTENEVNVNPNHNWKDITGERYHFPNKYKNRLKPGTPFVYYRGSLRAGGKKKTPEYFGRGVIGEVWEDPETFNESAQRKNWFFEVLEYVEFAKPVLFRDGDGTYIETGSTSVPGNYFRDGVRSIERLFFDRILSLAEMSAEIEPVEIQPNDLKEILVENDLLTPKLPRKVGENSVRTGSGYIERRSKSAKQIGDLGEKIVLEYLRNEATSLKEADKIVWVAQQGKKPGYDIEDCRNRNAIVGYEVKATTGAMFPHFDLTDNELQTACEMGENYILALVSNVTSEKPRLQFITNPYKLIEDNELMVRPVVHRVERYKKEE